MGNGYVMVIASAVLFGLMPLLAKEIYAMGGTALSLCVYRFLFSIPFLCAVVKGEKGQTFSITKEEAKKIFILSLGCAGTPFLLFQSYQYISSGMATTIHFIYPVLVLFGSVVLFREKFTKVKAVCAGLCAVGILCFYTPGEKAGLTGMILAFSSGITYAFYILYYTKSGLTALDPYKLSIYLSSFGAVLLLAAASATGQMVVRLPLKAWAMIIGFAFLMSFLATVFFQIGAKKIGPEKASLLSTFEPLTSVLAGTAFHGEQMTGKTVLGVVCILASVMLLTASGRKRRPRK